MYKRQDLRAVKEPSEVARLRAAQAVTDAAFAHIVAFMRPGMTEREVQIELEDFMRRHGAEGLAFPSIVATGPNGASPHAIPGATRLEAGQCVVLDFGARACGYCSDMTRTVFLGEPDERLRAAYEAIRQANEQVEAALRPGVTGKDMHELAERVLADHGFAGKMGHSLGHGVGIDIHEEPNLSPVSYTHLVRVASAIPRISCTTAGLADLLRQPGRLFSRWRAKRGRPVSAPSLPLHGDLVRRANRRSPCCAAAVQ